MLISAANNVYNFYPHINNINIFPIPDGDTGTNLCLTIQAGIEEILKLKHKASAKKIISFFSYHLLVNARGNSGVIFSQIFKGINTAFPSELKEIDFILIKNIFQQAYKSAYASVMKPVEGTMLTVVKNLYYKIKDLDIKQQNVKDVLFAIEEEAQKTLKNTKDLLPVLKEIKVVDAGAFGLVKFIMGAISFLRNKKAISKVKYFNKEINKISYNPFEEYGYCCELVIELYKKFLTFDINTFKNVVNNFGDSLIIANTQNIIKIHIHSLNPGNILVFCQQFGTFKNVKIENMTNQVNHKNLFTYQKNDYSNVLDQIHILPNDQIDQYFKINLNVKNTFIVNENSAFSSLEIIEFIKLIDAKNIIIFANSKNTVLPIENALQSLKIKQKCFLFETNNIAEGILTATAFDKNLSAKKNLTLFKEKLQTVKIVEI